jgi:HTH-type transcriptional regulator, sugar sensing transcriptional regulator
VDTATLESLGLARAEIKVFLALVDLGVSTVGPLTRVSHVPSSNIYPVLDSLTKKGLVSYSITANKRFFRAEDPTRLQDFLREQRELLESQEQKLAVLITELRQRHGNLEKTQEFNVYEGIKGLKTALEFVLKVQKKGDTFYVIDASRTTTEKLMGYFNDFAVRRARKGIKYKIIYGFDSIEFAHVRKKYRLTSVKILPKGIRMPSVFWIFGEYVVIAVMSDIPVALMIKSEQISQGFLANFNAL